MAMTADKARSRAVAGLLIAFVAPVIVVLSAFGARLGMIPVDMAVETFTLGVARVVAFAAPVAALGVLILTRAHWKATAKYGLAALVVSTVTLGVFLYQQQRMAVATPLDVTTHTTDAPRLRLQGGAPQTCPGLVPVETQLLPEAATSAMQSQGFVITRAGMFDVEGTRQGFWFGRRYDAVVRIRPGRTDLRLATEGRRADGDAVCRQALELAKALQAGA